MSKSSISDLNQLFKDVYGEMVEDLVYGPAGHSLEGPYRVKSDGEPVYAIHGKRLDKAAWEQHPEVVEYKRKQLIKELLSE